MALGFSKRFPWKRIAKRSVPRRRDLRVVPKRLLFVKVTLLENLQVLLTFASRLDSVLPEPLRLTVIRTLPLQPAALLTRLGSVIRPRVVKRYGAFRSRLGRTFADSPGRLRTKFGIGVEVAVGVGVGSV